VSQTPCWWRIKKLEENGYIDKGVALLSHRALNLAMIVYVMVKTAHHDDAWLKRFSDGVQSIPEIVEIHRMAGDIDYLLKVVAGDMAEYDASINVLLKSRSFQMWAPRSLWSALKQPQSYRSIGYSGSLRA
jgi:Lrp/AsnC family transcriptional regulator